MEKHSPSPPSLSPDQGQALTELHEFTCSKRTRHALSGPAGSGKTYLIGRFLEQTRLPIKISATTHKAAKVAARMTAEGEAATIHSLLGLQPEADTKRGRMILKRKRDPKVEAGELVIVDEASMIDSELLAVIDEYASALDFRVLYVGDRYQLPPIFESESPCFARVPTSHLTTIHRQALDNPLIATATGFREVLDGAPFPVIEPRAPGVYCTSPQRFEEAMLSAFDRDEYAEDADFCRAIAWTNRRVVELNRIIRRRLVGPEAELYPFTEGETFIVNEAVTRNDALLIPTEARVTIEKVVEHAITDIETGITVNGYRLTVSPDPSKLVEVFAPADREAARAVLSAYASKARALQRECDIARKMSTGPSKEQDEARRSAWRAFFDVKEAFADLRPPHACTVHKAQGSTFRHAFIDIGDIGRCTRWDLIARLVYVALTRAAESAITTGTLPARLYQREAA
jgi:exodeoxyribonuclease-5